MIQFALNLRPLDPKDEFFGARQEIPNESQISERLVRVFYFPLRRLLLEDDIEIFL